MTDLQIRIVKSYARNNMKLYPTANELHYHRNSVEYQMDKIKNETGLDPRKFDELCKLLFPMIGGELHGR